MKKLVMFYFLLFFSLTLYSQNFYYGLSERDLNLLLGQFVPSAEIAGYRWIAQPFSWGRQTAIDTNGDQIRIDYSSRYNEQLGFGYERYLVISDNSIPFVITRIEKAGENRFVLTLVLVVNPNEPKIAGQITITFIDDIHIVIDNTNFLVNGSFNYMVLWKSAGPTVTVRNRRNFHDLLDFR